MHLVELQHPIYLLKVEGLLIDITIPQNSRIWKIVKLSGVCLQAGSFLNPHREMVIY